MQQPHRVFSNLKGPDAQCFLHIKPPQRAGASVSDGYEHQTHHIVSTIFLFSIIVVIFLNMLLKKLTICLVKLI